MIIGGELRADGKVWLGSAPEVLLDEHGCAGALNGLRGSFAAVQEACGRLLCAVDPVASIPLFYAMHDGRAFVSDDAAEIARAIGASVNELDAAEFLQTGYVTGERTLF